MSAGQRPWSVVVVGLDHMHAGDQVAVIQADPNTVLVGVWDGRADRLHAVCDDLGLGGELRFEGLDAMLDHVGPDVAVVCSTTSLHLAHTRLLSARGIHVLLEKPLASSLQDALAIADAAGRHDILVGVNWPLAWFPSHRTTKRLVDDGMIGDVIEVHYYDGNRGPLFHTHGKKEIDGETARAVKAGSWWYDPKQGGGSLRDYLGYGATLATWFRDGVLPTEVVARTHHAPGDEVDEQSVVVAVYPEALSTFQTRWGTFSDPWTHQPAPRCGFVVVGTGGTVSSWDYAEHVDVQTDERPEGTSVPVDDLPHHERGGLPNLLHRLVQGAPLDGPLSLEISLAGQRIVEAAVESARLGRSVAVLGTGS